MCLFSSSSIRTFSSIFFLIRFGNLHMPVTIDHIVVVFDIFINRIVLCMEHVPGKFAITFTRTEIKQKILDENLTWQRFLGRIDWSNWLCVSAWSETRIKRRLNIESHFILSVNNNNNNHPSSSWSSEGNDLSHGINSRMSFYSLYAPSFFILLWLLLLSLSWDKMLNFK